MKVMSLTSLSLILGALALLLMGYFVSGGGGDATSAPRQWAISNSLVKLGAVQMIEGNVQLVLDRDGRAVIALPAAGAALSHYPYLRIAFGDATAEPVALLLVRAIQGTSEHWVFRGEHVAPRDTWLYLGDTPTWQGAVTRIELFLVGTAGQPVSINEIGLYPRSANSALQTLLSAWTSSTPWRHSSINQHTGNRRQASSLYPLLAAAMLAACALAACGLMSVLFPTFRLLRWPAAGGIFLVCWILLDILWQWQLLQKLRMAGEQFAGRSNTEKLLAGPDSELVEISRAVKQALAGESARVLVSARDEYRGMRVAYYLYPLNVFWDRGGPPLPDPGLLRSGDYILLLQPNGIRLDRGNGLLRLPDQRTVRVTPVLTRDTGLLVRVI